MNAVHWPARSHRIFVIFGSISAISSRNAESRAFVRSKRSRATFPFPLWKKRIKDREKHNEVDTRIARRSDDRYLHASWRVTLRYISRPMSLLPFRHCPNALFSHDLRRHCRARFFDFCILLGRIYDYRRPSSAVEATGATFAYACISIIQRSRWAHVELTLKRAWCSLRTSTKAD